MNAKFTIKVILLLYFLKFQTHEARSCAVFIIVLIILSFFYVAETTVETDLCSFDT